MSTPGASPLRENARERACAVKTWISMNPLSRTSGEGCVSLLLVAVAGSVGGTAVTLVLVAALSGAWRDPLELLPAVLIIGMGLFAIGLAGAFCGTFLWGLPVMMALRHERAESLGAYASMGAAGGLLFCLLVSRLRWPEAAIYLAYGTATGAAFWRFYRRAAAEQETAP
jgi:hypothetical protein